MTRWSRSDWMRAPPMPGVASRTVELASAPSSLVKSPAAMSLRGEGGGLGEEIKCAVVITLPHHIQRVLIAPVGL